MPTHCSLQLPQLPLVIKDNLYIIFIHTGAIIGSSIVLGHLATREELAHGPNTVTISGEVSANYKVRFQTKSTTVPHNQTIQFIF